VNRSNKRHSPRSTAGRRLRRAGALLLLLAATLAGTGSASAAPSLSWSSPAAVVAGLDGVSCPSFGLCVAVAGTTARINTAPSSSTTWGAVPAIAAHPLLAVSCAPGSTFCAAVGQSGQITVTNDAQNGASSHWTVPSLPETLYPLTGVSCPSTSLCVAVDTHGEAVMSTTPTTGGWSVQSNIDSTNNLLAVSCATAALCAAVDLSGNILVSTTPATNAPWITADSVSGPAGNPVAIACSAVGSCVAVTSTGRVLASANPSSGDGSTWSRTHIDSASGLTSVSCSGVALCTAGDGAGNIYVSDAPAASPASWTATQPDAGHAVAGLSCVLDGLCAAVDNAGNALTATLPPPGAATGSGTASSQTTATLSATVTPSDATITDCHFNYGTNPGYGASIPCSATPSATGGSQTVTAVLSGLSAATVYDFQVVAVSADGASTGTNATFTTPQALKPSVSIGGVPAVGQTLTCNLGVTVPAGLTVTFKWVRDTTAIVGATAATYQVAIADESHHLTCGATISGDGGSASSGSGYVAVPAETLGTINETTIAHTAAVGHTVTTSVTCSPQALTACTISLRLTARVRSGSSHHTVAIGSKSERIAAGATVTVVVSLNSTGSRLLASKGHLKTTLTVTGTIVGAISGTIRKQSVTLANGHHSRRHGA